MKCLFFISLIFALTSCMEDKSVKSFVKQPHMFASVLSKIEPGESKQAAENIESLIATGEEERDQAKAELDVAQGALDVAKAALDKAINERAAKDGELDDANAEVERLTALKSQRKTTMEEKQEDRVNKDAAVPIAAQRLDDENERIDSEKAIFENIITKVETLSPSEDEGYDSSQQDEGDYDSSQQDQPLEQDVKEIQVHRKLLAYPSLMSILNAADPAALQKLIDLVNRVIQEGENQRAQVKQDNEDAIEAARVAAEVQVQSETDYATTTQDLVVEKEHVTGFEAQLVELKTAETLADTEHTKKTKARDSKKVIFDAETDRINSELATYNEAIADLNKLEDVVSLLA